MANPNDPNGKVPVITQTKEVRRSPLVSSNIEPRSKVTVAARADLTREYVASGTQGWQPFLRALPNYIDDISQQFGLEVYARMMTDPVVYASERVFTLALLANGYEIVPSIADTEPDYDIAKKMCDFVKENIENLATPYDVILEQQLNAFEYGCSIGEQMYQVDDFGGEYSEVSSSNLLIRLADIRDKPLQNAVFIADSYNNTVGILTQRFPGQVYPAGSFIPIPLALTNGRDSGETRQDDGKEFDLSKVIPGFLPRSKFAVLTNEMRYNDERGRSGLRAAYSAWWFKQQVIAEYLSYMSKFASPSIVVNLSQNAQPEKEVDENLEPVLDDDGNERILNPAEVVGAELRNFSNGMGLILPFDAKATPINVTGDGAAFAKALNWCNAEIVRGITFQYLATSEGEHQARASSETHQDILTLGFRRRKLWVANQQRREVFLPLLRMNFDITGKKIRRYVPRLNLGLGAGFPLTVSDIASLAGKYPIDPSQHAAIDELIGLPRRETIMVNGVPTTPAEQAKQQREDQQRQEDLNAQNAQLQGGQGGAQVEEGQ